MGIGRNTTSKGKMESTASSDKYEDEKHSTTFFPMPVRDFSNVCSRWLGALLNLASRAAGRKLEQGEGLKERVRQTEGPDSELGSPGGWAQPPMVGRWEWRKYKRLINNV
ncbi:hypothetical protein scyTo_0026364 [Scyliorhinus torazame]|uniref:Uncharacterized protein n=1 Tax=Scyliorhinus torazame TaxID=75743 RepID=A0A401QJZ9_SCYTO|nr:hypothetical protein [Scyliorhinus torazame]